MKPVSEQPEQSWCTCSLLRTTLEISGGEPFVVSWSICGSVDTNDLLTLENKPLFMRVPLGYRPIVKKQLKNKLFGHYTIRLKLVRKQQAVKED